jgi:hypothetical protein
LSQTRGRRGIKSTPFAPEISTLAQFIEPRRAMVLSAELTRFHEAEEGETTQVFGHVAQRFSAYVKSGTMKGVAFKARGMICTQFVHTPDGWKMSAMAWDDERPGLAMASHYDRWSVPPPVAARNAAATLACRPRGAARCELRGCE